MTSHWYGYFLVAALCGVKFMPGAITCIICGVSFTNQFIVTATGGCIGIIFFTYFGDLVGKLMKKIKNKYFLKNKTEIKSQVIVKKNLASRIWDRYGLLGAAILTPPLLSPPVGAALALSYGTPKSKILIYYLSSMIIWALIFATFGNSILHLIEYIGIKHPDCGGLK